MTVWNIAVYHPIPRELIISGQKKQKKLFHVLYLISKKIMKGLESLLFFVKLLSRLLLISHLFSKLPHDVSTNLGDSLCRH